MYKIIQKIWLWWITSSRELSKRQIAKLVSIDGYYPVIFEIGSYNGKDTQEIYRAISGIPNIFCFEADERIYEEFNKNIGTVEPIRLNKCAVGNFDGYSDFYLSESETRRHSGIKEWSASSSLKQPEHHLELFKDVEFNKVKKVLTVKLDTWMKKIFNELSIKNRKISFIWCDINGAEEDFILGAYSTLNNQTRYLYIEFSDKKLYKDQITKDRILELLPNFELQGVYNFRGNFGNLLLRNKTL